MSLWALAGQRALISWFFTLLFCLDCLWHLPPHNYGTPLFGFQHLWEHPKAGTWLCFSPTPFCQGLRRVQHCPIHTEGVVQERP